MNLAQILYNAYPHSDLLPIDPQSDLENLATLRKKVASTNIGDGLFTFLVIELDEGGGTIDEVIRLLRQARNDVDAVLQVMLVEKRSLRLWQCPKCHQNAEVSYEDLVIVGNPLCSDCDSEMELL